MTLQSLPEPLLLSILSRLDSLDLVRCGQVSRKLERVAQDWTLWKEIRIVEEERFKISKGSLRQFIPYLGAGTTDIAIVYTKVSKQQPFSAAFLQSVCTRCPNLLSFSLERGLVEASDNLFALLPRSLERLSIKGCYVRNLPSLRSTLNSPLHKLHTRLKQLTWVDVSHTQRWFGITDLLNLFALRANGPVHIALPSGVRRLLSTELDGPVGRRDLIKAHLAMRSTR